MTSEETGVFRGSGNVFADLGFADADGMLARAELVRRICAIVEARKMSRSEVAQVLGLAQPDVSALMHGKFLRRFSTERLMRLLLALGQDVEIVVRPKARGRAAARLSVGPAA